MKWVVILTAGLLTAYAILAIFILTSPQVLRSNQTRPPLEESVDPDFLVSLGRIRNNAPEAVNVWINGTLIGTVASGDDLDVRPHVAALTGSRKSLTIVRESDRYIDCAMLPLGEGDAVGILDIGKHVAKPGLELPPSVIARGPGAIVQQCELAMRAEIVGDHVFRTVIKLNDGPPADPLSPPLYFIQSNYNFTINSMGMRYVEIAAGTFEMGEPSEFVPGESLRTVMLTSAYNLQQTEVTNIQWNAVMVSKATQGVPAGGAAALLSSILRTAKPNQAAASMTWEEAVLFSRELAKHENREYSLPTEAQWEYACRAGTRSSYFFGDWPSELHQYSWYAQNSGGAAHDVALKKPNPWHLYDMTGNVREWCADWFVMPYPGGRVLVDPAGGTKFTSRAFGKKLFENESRSVRGGMFSGIPAHDLSGGRGSMDPGGKIEWVGLRTVMRDRPPTNTAN